MDYRRVYGGTPKEAGSRCDSCTYARVIRGYADSEQVVICGRFYPAMKIGFKVYTCTEYLDRTLPDYEDMAKIAWEIRPRTSAGAKAGFLPPEAKPVLVQVEEED
jgi:hypothetical protein